ncbi:MAG TPA: inosine/xanthosine triphosphatase [Aggregatilineales bacterium]|nr:inosine/xanthosine triphosphatase [Aggregatilineales bacterium]
MHIVIGSTNPVKRAAVEKTLSLVFPAASYSTVSVPSGVSDQPRDDHETRQGAENRARAVLQLEHLQADAGVGLEGGVIDTELGMMTTAWCVLVMRDGRVGVGGGIHLMLPEAVARAVRSGVELGTAMDALVGEHNTKQKYGAIGILTDGLLDRQQAYEVIVQLAVAPFRRPDFYRVENL